MESYEICKHQVKAGSYESLKNHRKYFHDTQLGNYG